jgi:hypothetical protein
MLYAVALPREITRQTGCMKHIPNTSTIAKYRKFTTG